MFETIESFQKKIYVLQQKTNQSLIETIIQFCDERKIEYESVAPFISGKLNNGRVKVEPGFGYPIAVSVRDRLPSEKIYSETMK